MAPVWPDGDWNFVIGTGDSGWAPATLISRSQHLKDQNAPRRKRLMFLGLASLGASRGEGFADPGLLWGVPDMMAERLAVIDAFRGIEISATVVN